MRYPPRLRDASDSQGLSLVEILLLVTIIFVCLLLIVPGFIGGRGDRALCAGVLADLRSLAVGIEMYYVDHGSYPAWTSLSGSNQWTGHDGLGHANAFAGSGAGAARIHSFRAWTASPDDPEKGAANQFLMMTTPVAYLYGFFPDRFATTKGASYGYYSTEEGYIVYSYGPDRDENPNSLGHSGDIDAALEVTDLRDLETGRPIALSYDRTSTDCLTLFCGPEPTWSSARGTGAFTYDLTNGTTSEGDIWRVKY